MVGALHERCRWHIVTRYRAHFRFPCRAVIFFIIQENF